MSHVIIDPLIYKIDLVAKNLKHLPHMGRHSGAQKYDTFLRIRKEVEDMIQEYVTLTFWPGI